MAIIFLLVLVKGCISIKINDDGSAGLEKTNKISAFSILDIDKKFEYKKPSEINFQEINAENIQEIRAEKEKVWIYVWGSWCQPCIEKLPNLVDIGRKNKELKLVLIAEDYKLEALQNILFENGYSEVPYLLDSEQYGTKTKEKSRRLNQEMTGASNHQAGFPQNYLYNSITNKEYYQAGAITDEMLESFGILLSN